MKMNIRNGKQWLLCAVLLGGTVVIGCSIAGATPVSQVQESGSTRPRRIYLFHALTALPQNGSAVQLSTGFVLKLTPDSLICYLPYYGRAYQAAYNNNAGVMDFTSVRFRCQEHRSKKGVQTITVTPEDNREVRALYITITGDGYASVAVSFNQRQPIAYHGQLTTQP